MQNIKKKIKIILLSIIIILLVLLLSIKIFVHPSNNRDWSPDQKILTHTKINGSEIEFYNIRNISYNSTKNYTVAYYNKTFDTSNVKQLYFVLEPFATKIAHTMLTFEFENNEFISMSIEIRKEKEESFSPIKGLLRRYELMYVWGDENDLIKLRTNFRNNTVYLYPVNSTKEFNERLLVKLAEETNKIKETPRFYNTLTDTCTTLLMKHVNGINPKEIPLDIRLALNEDSDKMIYDLGLIKTNTTFGETREYYKINELAIKNTNPETFSREIRKPILN